MPDLARELTGDLPCVGCGYNLRSISVLGVCPECATPVRATLLARVDPYAGVLQPIDRPRLRSAGLFLWAAAAIAAALVTWGIRLSDAVEGFATTTLDTSRLIIAGTLLLILSGLGAAIALVHPHSGIPRRQILLAIIGVLAYVPLAMLYWQIHAVYDLARLAPYIVTFAPDAERALLRILAGLFMLLIVVGLRPNLRMLTSRSLLVRMGRVDRQTMLGLAAAISLAILGDLVHILGADLAPRAASAAFLLGVVLIAVGSALLTVGLVGILIDTLRLMPVILRPPLSFRQVLGERSPDASPGKDPHQP